MSKDCRDSAKMSTMQAMKKTHGVMKIDDTAINAHLTTRVTAQKKAAYAARRQLDHGYPLAG
ncbi:hypothetical protein BZG73_02095 [Salinivibrio siamensis]|uniref:Uncharacterized protein n=1 Tax=Salinivibrio siamensis TaxID=414286 RepID=A0ABX3KEK7_9GAMM|nr:hypothetical protein BZG73_02095 [Salinivibrio siamensis]